MSMNFWVVGAILFACGPCYAQAPTSDVQVPSIANSSLKLEDSTPVILRTKQDLSSATAKVGDRVPLRVVNDIRVADLIVIPKGADAWGLITAVQPRARKGRPGKLDLAIQSVQLLTGTNVPLRAEQHSEGKSRDVGTMADLPNTAIATFGMGVPIEVFSMLEKGRDAYWGVGTRFTAYVNGDVVLDRSALHRVQPAPLRPKGPATVTVFRTADTRMLGSPPVYCGKVALAKLPRPAYLRVQLPAGKYVFRSSDEQGVEVSLEEGQELYLQMHLVVPPKRHWKNRLVQVDNEDGEDRVATLHQLGDKDVKKVTDADLVELKAALEVK